MSMWDRLDEVAPGYQDTLVMHMIHKPIEVSFAKDPDRSVIILSTCIILLYYH